ncbi:hypothetical protein V4Y02_23750, partial [Escherichia coli]
LMLGFQNLLVSPNERYCILDLGPVQVGMSGSGPLGLTSCGNQGWKFRSCTLVGVYPAGKGQKLQI